MTTNWLPTTTRLFFVAALSLSPLAACDDGSDTGDDDEHSDEDAGASEGSGSHGEVPDDYAGKENPNAADDTDAIDAGQEIFEEHCVVCHGDDGTGNDGAAKDLTSSTAAGWADDFMLWKISDGDGSMPAFADKLSEADIWNVISYCRTLSE